jgi:hypothetical protein
VSAEEALEFVASADAAQAAITATGDDRPTWSCWRVMVQNWLESIAQNLVAEFLFLLILLALGWLLYRVTRRGPLLSFFGIKGPKRLVVYLSNLRIQQGGALGVDGLPRSFGENALPAYEADLMPWLQRLFNYVVPGTNEQPGFLKWLQLSDVVVEFAPSPLDESDIERDSTFIAVGSPGYNRASSYVEDSLHSIGRFTNDNSAITLAGASPLHSDHYAFVQRAGNSKRWVFYAAGISSRGTTGAVRFLVTHWHDLNEKYPGGKPFCVMLRITSEDGSKYQIVYERE